jgi:hypothetical protein
MNTYEVTFSEGINYKTTVQAEDESEAFIKARDEAATKGIRLPVEVWTNIEKIENN